MPLFDFTGNAVVTSLASGISDTATSMTLNDATGWPDGSDGNWTATLARGVDGEEERVLCGTRSGTTVTILQRGYDGNQNVQHDLPTTVEHTISGVFAKDVSEHAHKTTRDDHTQYLNETRHDVQARHPTAVFPDNAITTPKINGAAVTTAKLGADAVTAAKLADDAVSELGQISGDLRGIASTATEPADGTNAFLWVDSDDDEWHIWDGSAFENFNVQRTLLADPPRVKRTDTVSQIVSSDLVTPTVLIPSTSGYDTDSIYQGSGLFQPPTLGTYAIYARIQAAQDSGTATGLAWMIFNGSDELVFNTISTNAIIDVGTTVTFEWDFDGTTTVEVGWSHNASSSQDVWLRDFRMRWVCELP